jgi:hypothetical protein
MSSSIQATSTLDVNNIDIMSLNVSSLSKQAVTI